MRVEELVARNVRAAREERGLNGADLGRRVGEWLTRPWPRQTVSAIESGKRAFTAEDLLALSLVLEKPIAYFFRAAPDEEIAMPSGASVSASRVASLFSEYPPGAFEAIFEDVQAARDAHAKVSDRLQLIETVVASASGAVQVEVGPRR